MQRIANGTQVSVMPTPAAAVGTPGYATNGNPAAGQEATIFGADDFNRIQEELVSVILGAGLTLNGSDNAQLLAALKGMFRVGMAVFTSSGTFTVPAGVTKVKVRAWGGGGSGRSTSDGQYPGGGGGGGGYGESVIDVSGIPSIPVTVGAGGLNGPGGSSSFGAYLTANGGSAGGAGTAGATGAGGSGGGVSGAQIAIPGSSASPGIVYSSTVVEGGNGGAAFGGQPVRAAGSPAAGITGSPGIFPGGGSSGCTGSGLAAGANGLVIIEW